MLENPSWRSRYLSIYGETIRKGILEQSLILTYVNTDQHLADALTKPTIQKVNGRICPLWGMVHM